MMKKQKIIYNSLLLLYTLKKRNGVAEDEVVVVSWKTLSTKTTIIMCVCTRYCYNGNVNMPKTISITA